MAIGTAAAVLGGLSLASGAYSAYQNRKAAQDQQRGIGQGLEIQQNLLNQIREDNAPFRDASTTALNRLMGLFSDPNDFLQNNPMINAIRDMRQRQIENSAAQKGLLFSGGTLKNIANNVADVALPFFNNQANHLAGISRMGLGLNQAPIAVSNNITGLYQDQGNVNANQRMNNANILANTLGNLSQIPFKSGNTLWTMGGTT